MTEAPVRDDAVKLRRVSRPAVIVGALVLVAVMLVAAFIAGLSVRTPAPKDEGPLAAASVTTDVQLRVVEEGVQVVGRVADPEILKLSLVSDEPLGALQPEARESEGSREEKPQSSTTQAIGPTAARNVVTLALSPVGADLVSGAQLAEVSGRPVVAVPAATPLYRDFKVGIEGEDVRAVQQLLADLGYWVDVDGLLDVDTMDVIRYWYAQMGYSLAPGGGTTGVLPWGELLALPDGQLTVTKAAAVGTALGEEQPLLEVRRGRPLVEAVLNEAQVESFRSDSSVFLLANGESYPSEVLSIGELETDKDTAQSGRRMTVACPPELAAQMGAGSAVAVASAAPNSPAPAVPVTALNEDDKGQYVLVERARDESTKGDERAYARVEVEVQAVSVGWAAILENPELPEGTRIRVG